MSAPSKFTQNNFDLIRLVAALQVALLHTAGHLGYDARWLDVLSYFPGVPIFFFISGFLIYQSWCNLADNRPRTFFTNRFLRLFPGLWVCLAVSLLLVQISGYFDTVDVPASGMGAWLLAQLSVFQFYNPDFLRGYGMGVLNGSLWTISVEIQFYLLTPIVFVILQRRKAWGLALIAAMIVVNALNTQLNTQTTLIEKLFAVSFLPWWSMFLVGAWMSTELSLREKVLRVPLLAWLAVYLAWHITASRLGLGAGNGIDALSYALLSGLVLKCAYSKPDLASRLLRRNDISYGVYIYHMPVVNFLLQLKWAGTAGSFAVAVASTIALGMLSWFLVERPALSLKKASLRRHTAGR